MASTLIRRTAGPIGLTRAEDLPLARRAGAFMFLMVTDFFYGWSFNSADVLRPEIQKALGLSLEQAGAMYTAQGIGALTGAVVIAQLADRFGRRNILFLVMAGYGLALAAGTLVGSFAGLMAQRLLLGLFLGGVFPTVVGIYTSLFDRAVCGRLAGFYNGTFNASVFVIGLVVGTMGVTDWRTVLLIGAVPPLLAAPLAFLIVPDDRRVIPHGIDGRPPAVEPRLPVLDLLAPDLRRRTLLLALMVGLNFFGAQAFMGWQTTYLQDVAGVPAALAKQWIGWQFLAAIAGGFFWGWIADRFGRRVNAFGFLVGAGLIVWWLLEAPATGRLPAIGVLFGFFIAASVVWGPWIAELYPARLRSTAASIFNWGYIVSFFAPLVTAHLSASVGLGHAMLGGGVAFGLAAMIWLLLPETLGRAPGRAATPPPFKGVDNEGFAA